MPTDPKYDRILAYLKGLFSNRQRHDLEKEMMQDLFDEEAFEGLSQLSGSDLETDMELLHRKLDARIIPARNNRFIVFFRMAAAVILLIGAGGVLYFVLRTPNANLLTDEHKIEKPAVRSAPPLNPVQPEAEKEKTSQPVQEKKADIARPPLQERQTSQPAVENQTGSKEENLDQPAAVAENESTKEPDVSIANESDVSMANEPAKSMTLMKSAAASEKTRKVDDTAGEPVVVKPIPPGGSLRSFEKWVSDRLDYPAYKDFPGKHKITVVLTVHSNGTIGNIRPDQNVPGAIAADLKKVISQSSLWTAARKDGEPLDTEVEIHFVITVE